MEVVSQPVMPEPLPREPGRDDLRASDADRQAVVERLRRAHDEGRLDLSEFDDRARRAYAARTYSELGRLTSDLPADPAAARLPAVAEPDRVSPRRRLSPAVSTWLFVSLVNFVIWAIVSITALGLVYPWWIWVAGPWGAVLAARWLSERGGRGR
jgi:Domain of unknown function (DUF1707)